MVRFLLRVLALFVVGGASFYVQYVLWSHRMESWDDLLFILGVDLLVGITFGLAALLLFGLGRVKASRLRWLGLAVLAMVIGMGASSPLLYLHAGEYVVRSVPEMEIAEPGEAREAPVQITLSDKMAE